MENYEPKKLALIRIWQILKEYSDADHPMTQEDRVTCLSVLSQQLYLNTGSLYSLLFFIPFCHTSL